MPETASKVTDDQSSPLNLPQIFISAAEPSGDRHAAGLIREIHKIRPELTFWGVAGPQMQSAGCQAIDDLTSRSAMLLEAIRLAGHAYRLLNRITKMLRTTRCDLAVLVDSPALHLPMAKRLRAAGRPVLYYIAPQLWAWAPWRIGRLRQRVNRVAAILPFEEEYFRKRGVDARFVGHPLIEQLQSYTPSTELCAALRSLGRPLIACLPGSRGHVIAEVLPGQIQIARAIADRHHRAAFLFAAVNKSAADMIQAALDKETFTSCVKVGRNAEILTVADLALCASGTATLEVAYYCVPMVVMYNGSKWGYRLIGRWLIQTPYLSLVNILANRRIVPEFMPYYTSTDPIAAEALEILDNENRRAAMQADLEMVINSLGTASAAAQTAEMALEMIGDKSFE